MRVCVHGKDVLSLLYSRPLSRVSKCSNMSMNASKNFLLRRISPLPHSEDFRCKDKHKKRVATGGNHQWQRPCFNFNLEI